MAWLCVQHVCTRVVLVLCVLTHGLANESSSISMSSDTRNQIIERIHSRAHFNSTGDKFNSIAQIYVQTHTHTLYTLHTHTQYQPAKHARTC